MGAKARFLNTEKAHGRDPVEKGRLKMPNRETVTYISSLLRMHARVISRTQTAIGLRPEEQPFFYYNHQSREGRDVLRWSQGNSRAPISQ